MSTSFSSCDPRKDDKDTSSSSGFPYEYLPNEMKVPILENIHDPLDKLHILEALPSTEWLMGWDYKSLQFESVENLLHFPFHKKLRFKIVYKLNYLCNYRFTL